MCACAFSALQPHDSIDFTDNDIQVLGNFPLSPRIVTLLLAHNRVSSIQASLPNAIPNLQKLVLASNSIAELADLDVLAGFKRLTHLVLAENPVTKKEVRARPPPCEVLTRRRRAVLCDGRLTCVCCRTTVTGSSGGVPPSASSTTRR